MIIAAFLLILAIVAWVYLSNDQPPRVQVILEIGR